MLCKHNTSFVKHVAISCCCSLSSFQPLPLLLCVSLLHLSACLVISQTSPAWSLSCLQFRLLCLLLQPPHVINHVKWQKAQHCQDCEGDLMELKMGCFVVMQSILFHLFSCLLARFQPCPQTVNSSSRARYEKK